MMALLGFVWPSDLQKLLYVRRECDEPAAAGEAADGEIFNRKNFPASQETADEHSRMGVSCAKTIHYDLVPRSIWGIKRQPSSSILFNLS